MFPVVVSDNDTRVNLLGASIYPLCKQAVNGTGLKTRITDMNCITVAKRMISVCIAPGNPPRYNAPFPPMEYTPAPATAPTYVPTPITTPAPMFALRTTTNGNMELEISSNLAASFTEADVLRALQNLPNCH